MKDQYDPRLCDKYIGTSLGSVLVTTRRSFGGLIMVLLVHNNVTDFDHWRRVFDSQAETARAAGLNLIQLWRSVDDTNEVFFLFEVEDRGRAEALMSAPEAATVGSEAGVIEGDFHFLAVDEVYQRSASP